MHIFEYITFPCQVQILDQNSPNICGISNVHIKKKTGINLTSQAIILPKMNKFLLVTERGGGKTICCKKKIFAT